MSVGWYPEAAVTERLLLSPGVMSRFRSSLKKNDDWIKNGREILLSPGAVKKLLVELGSPNYDISSCAIQKNGRIAAAQEAVNLTVTRIFPNPRLIMARLEESGEEVRVIVPFNVNFQPRMQIKARPPLKADGPQLYRLEGRIPRFKGKW